MNIFYNSIRYTYFIIDSSGSKTTKPSCTQIFSSENHHDKLTM